MTLNKDHRGYYPTVLINLISLSTEQDNQDKSDEDLVSRREGAYFTLTVNNVRMMYMLVSL